MLKSILGTKIGMTQIFDETGDIIPVTIISADPCLVTEVRTKERDGYCAVQLGYGKVKVKNVIRPLLGQFTKKNLEAKRFLREFRVDDPSKYQIGQEIKADLFKAGDYVDVRGVSKGKGFAGTIKRHNFSGGQKTHGQSDRQRSPGSIGAQRPTHVMKGKKMAGHLGDETVTIQKLKIVAVDIEKNIVLIDGSVPGANKSLVVISRTVKKVKAPQPKQVIKGKKIKPKK